MDTKGDELLYLAKKMRALGSRVATVDVSAKPAPGTEKDAADVISIADVMRHHPDEMTREARNLPSLPRAEAVAAVSVALKAFLSRAHDANEVSGVIGIGGSGGTSLIAAALNELPIGIPKMIVSTVGL